MRDRDGGVFLREQIKGDPPAIGGADQLLRWNKKLSYPDTELKLSRKEIETDNKIFI